MAESNKSPDLPGWIKDHISRYVATDGADGYLWDASIGGGKGMVPTLLLTTVGRKSGRVLTLKPEVQLQVKAEKFKAVAHTADAAERAKLWPKMVEIYGPYADYQTKTDRQIPVVVLKPV